MTATFDVDVFERWTDRQSELIEAERAAELEENGILLTKCSTAQLAKRGLALLNLSVRNVSIGLGGKTLVELERHSAFSDQPAFPPHTFRSGDIAGLSAAVSEKAKSKTEVRLEGVVSRVGDTRITLALQNKGNEDLQLPERGVLVKLANDATFDRMERTLKDLRARVVNNSPDPLTSVLLGCSSPSFSELADVGFLDENLNDSQRAAVRFCLSADQCALIHGPPGTGKTFTLVEIIRQLVKRGKRCLVCGASNLAVDNLVERLALHQVPLTRIGHPARVISSVQTSTLDYQCVNSDAAEIVRDIKKEIDQTMNELSRGKIKGKDRKDKWNEVKELRKEYRQREAKVTSSVLAEVRVVLSTCHGAGSRQLNNMTFDVVIIDEAAQALEAICWIPIAKAKKLILAGDHLQLPPTIKSTKNAKPMNKGNAIAKADANGVEQPEDTSKPLHPLKPPKDLSYTLFDRLMDLHGSKVNRLLTVQYRMHERIMQFASQQLYGSKLSADKGVAGRLLADLVQADDEVLSEPVIFIDTSGTDMYERADEDSLRSDSKMNENEADLVVKHVKRLLAAGIAEADISIISPYQAQVALLSNLMKAAHPALEIGSVDGFQGRENEVVILSLVRSNDKKEVGFLSDHRRLNVAMTRPRRQLVVVGDSTTVGAGTSFLKRWMAWLEENADVHLAGIEQ